MTSNTLNPVKGKYKRATLGTLIEKAEKNGLLDKNMISALKMISKQRNYITHNIYALFIDQLEETDRQTIVNVIDSMLTKKKMLDLLTQNKARI